MCKILVADDHSMIRKGLNMLLADQFPNASLQFASTGEEVLHAVRKIHFDLLISDMNIPDVGSFSLFEQLLLADPDIKVLIYTMNAEQVFAMRYLQLGAYGYLEKTANDSELVKAVDTVLKGKRYFSQEVMEMLTISFSGGKKITSPFDSLSTREMEICMYLLKGHGVSKISEFLNLHTSTIATQKARIFKKVAVENLYDLTDLAKTYKVV